MHLDPPFYVVAYRDDRLHLVAKMPGRVKNILVATGQQSYDAKFKTVKKMGGLGKRSHACAGDTEGPSCIPSKMSWRLAGPCDRLSSSLVRKKVKLQRERAKCHIAANGSMEPVHSRKIRILKDFRMN